MGSSIILVSFTLVVTLAISFQSLQCQEIAGIKIYGYPDSPNTRRVLAVLIEKRVSYQFVYVDLKAGDQKKPSFLSLNPFGQVPVMIDGDLKLTESRAISEYIATIHRSSGTQLLNYKNHKTMGTQQMWMNIESLECDPLTSILTWEQSIKPMYGLKTDYKVVNETEAKLEKVLNIYEERLQISNFLASNSFTMADLYHLPNIQYLMDTPTKRLFENRPNVHRWVAKITSRQDWKRAFDVRS